MEVRRREIRRSKRDKISRIFNAEERRGRKTYYREEEESNDSDEKNVEYRREDIPKRLHEKNEDV